MTMLTSTYLFFVIFMTVNYFMFRLLQLTWKFTADSENQPHTFTAENTLPIKSLTSDQETHHKYCQNHISKHPASNGIPSHFFRQKNQFLPQYVQNHTQLTSNDELNISKVSEW